MEKSKLLITESQDFSSEAIQLLQEKFEVVIGNVKSTEELLDLLNDCEVAFIRLKFYFGKEVLSKLPKLKYILTATTGLDHIDVDYFEKHGGKVISLKGEYSFLQSIPSTAEHTWALILALLKKLPQSFQSVQAGNWNRNLFKGNNLKNKKIGILGLGRVGKQVAKFAQAFDMEVAFYDIATIESEHLQFKTPQELFKWADILTIHIPLNESNIQFVNEELLELLSSKSVIINTSRGLVWDELAIVELVKKNKIAGVATDVLQNEMNIAQVVNSDLIKMSNQGYNVIITPHIAGATYESMSMTENFISKKFIGQLKNN